jgi:hypothetical protein
MFVKQKDKFTFNLKANHARAGEVKKVTGLLLLISSKSSREVPSSGLDLAKFSLEMPNFALHLAKSNPFLPKLTIILPNMGRKYHKQAGFCY